MIHIFDENWLKGNSKKRIASNKDGMQIQLPVY